VTKEKRRIKTIKTKIYPASHISRIPTPKDNNKKKKGTNFVQKNGKKMTKGNSRHQRHRNQSTKENDSSKMGTSCLSQVKTILLQCRR
jgi:hypothetical protein